MKEHLDPTFMNNWPIQRLNGAASKYAREKHPRNAQVQMNLAAQIITDRINADREKYVSGMAVAFLDATGFKIEEAQLTVIFLPNGTGATYYFEKRPERKEPDAISERKIEEGGEHERQPPNA